MTTGPSPTVTHYRYDPMHDLSPLKTWRATQRIAGLFTDIDDTLTTDGAITPDALQALADLKAAGLSVVAITGRPVGWSEPFALQWPVDAIVAENGAVALRRAAAEDLVINIPLLPALQEFGFQLGQAGFHGKAGLGQVEGVFVIGFFHNFLTPGPLVSVAALFNIIYKYSTSRAIRQYPPRHLQGLRIKIKMRTIGDVGNEIFSYMSLMYN